MKDQVERSDPTLRVTFSELTMAGTKLTDVTETFLRAVALNPGVGDRTLEQHA